MEDNKQIEIFAQDSRESDEIIRCGICRRILTNQYSIRIGIGPVCRRKGYGSKTEVCSRNLTSISPELVEKIEFWGGALKSHLQDPADKMKMDLFIEKARRLMHMSPVLIAEEADKAVELYTRSGIRRDDIMIGLEGIVEATWEKN